MACPKCGCKETYQYDDYEAAFDLGSEIGYMERCAACGEVFDIEDHADEDDEPMDDATSGPVLPPRSEAEFLAKRLGRVAHLAGVRMPDMNCDQLAECAGTILGQIAYNLEQRATTDSAKDTKRLDWLDEVNAKTNAGNGTTYGWKFDINHNRAALTDHNWPALKVREAIDAAMAETPNG